MLAGDAVPTKNYTPERGSVRVATHTQESEGEEEQAK